MATSQEQLFDLLMERCSTDRYPSAALLNRIEAILWTPEQLAAYVQLLVEKIDQSWYPSNQLLDRVQRMMTLASVAAQRAAA